MSINQMIDGNPIELPQSSNYLDRPRLNKLLKDAMKCSLVVVCAGVGYGKTQAVYDFVREQHIKTIWVQLSERDNIGSRFWENFVHAVAQVNRSFAQELAEVGFPDSEDKLNQYIFLRKRKDEKEEE